MKINLLAIGKKMPEWVNTGYKEYANRLPREFSLNLIEIAAKKRSANSNIEQLLDQEGKLLLEAVPKNNKIIALDRTGKSFNTIELAQKFSDFYQQSQDICLLIGGPEGLSQTCLARAEVTLSLSALTLPHPLVRVLIAEQIYRVWSIMTQHPYHR